MNVQEALIREAQNQRSLQMLRLLSDSPSPGMVAWLNFAHIWAEEFDHLCSYDCGEDAANSASVIAQRAIEGGA